MKIRYWWKNLVNIFNNFQDTTDFQEQQTEINPEFEEKPVVDSITETSEDFHGGQELTFSMNSDSESVSDNNSEDTYNQNSEYSNNLESNDNEKPENIKSDSEYSDDNEFNESNEDHNTEYSSNTNDTTDDSNDAGNVKESKELENTINDSENSEEEQEQAEDYEYSESDNSDNDDYDYSDKRQTNKAFDVKETPVDRKLRTLFQRFIERIAELETKYEIPYGTERLSVKQLMKRTLNKKSLKSCYVDRYKDTVILLVDTSGSMDWWAEILSKITTIAMKRKDIEIYEAPNGIITRAIKSWKQLEEYYNWSEYEKFHEEFIRKTKNRVIIYIGDFDGGDTPYILAQKNKVYWICNESRYWDTAEHSWCSYILSEYPETCKILWAYDEEDLIRVFSGLPTKQKVYDDEDEYY